MTPRILSALALAATLPLALAGCSGSPAVGSSTPVARQTDTPGSAPAATSGSSGSGAPAASSDQLTGSELQALLLTGPALPSGLTVDASQDVNSGALLEITPAKFDLSSLDCGALLNDIGQVGFGENAMADSSATNSGGTAGLSQSVYQFSTTAKAQSFYSALSGKWVHCGSFTAEGGNGKSGTVTTTVTTAPTGLGQAAFAVTMHAQEDGTAATTSILGVLAGTDVYLVGPGGLNTSAVPANIDAAAFARQLIANVGKA